MKKASWMAVGAGLIAAAGAAAPVVWAADDDLTVVKRAVAVSEAAEEKEAPAARPAVAPRKSSRRPAWLKVTIVEEREGKKEATVSVTLPLALLSVLGKDASVDLSQLGVNGLKDHEKNVKILDVIETLEPGTMLVEVREEKEHIRVWVE